MYKQHKTCKHCPSQEKNQINLDFGCRGNCQPPTKVSQILQDEIIKKQNQLVKLQQAENDLELLQAQVRSRVPKSGKLSNVRDSRLRRMTKENVVESSNSRKRPRDEALESNRPKKRKYEVLRKNISRGYQNNNVSGIGLKTLTPLQPISMNELFQKLVDSGIVTTDRDTKTGVKGHPAMHRLTTSKLLQNSEKHCSSCNMTFSPDKINDYRDHLDWHYCENRKAKVNKQVAFDGKLCYSQSDWYFSKKLEEFEKKIAIPSTPSSPKVLNECCEVCRESLEQFFHHEEEEWHLRNAIRVDEKVFHPVCYNDYLKQKKSTLKS